MHCREKTTIIAAIRSHQLLGNVCQINFSMQVWKQLSQCVSDRQTQTINYWNTRNTPARVVLFYMSGTHLLRRSTDSFREKSARFRGKDKSRRMLEWKQRKVWEMSRNVLLLLVFEFSWVCKSESNSEGTWKSNGLKLGVWEREDEKLDEFKSHPNASMVSGLSTHIWHALAIYESIAYVWILMTTVYLQISPLSLS